MGQIIEISDLAIPELDVFARLTEAQLRSRRDTGKALFVAESPNVIARALDAGCEPISFLMERCRIEGQAKELIARCPDTPVYTADRAILAGLTGYEMTRGILCAMKRPVPANAAKICANAHRIAVLEGIVDSTNVGAIFRSAAALHVDAVLLTPTCCDPLTRRSARVSMGTVFQIPWARIGNSAIDWPERGLEKLKEMGFKTAAMALSDRSITIDDPVLKSEEKLAIVLGTEGSGLSTATIEGCDYTVKIPMSQGVDSLNVAAASAVAFWELRYNP